MVVANQRLVVANQRLVVANQRLVEVDPSIFVFKKWGINWNSVGLFFALLVACYWNIYTQDRSLGLVLGVEVYILSLILTSEFLRGFLDLLRTGLVEWYVTQGLKVEQRLRNSRVLCAGFLLVPISLCFAMHIGDSIVSQDAVLLLRISRGITYPYAALVLLFRGRKAIIDMMDSWDAPKTSAGEIRQPCCLSNSSRCCCTSCLLPKREREGEAGGP